MKVFFLFRPPFSTTFDFKFYLTRFKEPDPFLFICSLSMG